MIKRFAVCFAFIFFMVFVLLTIVSNVFPADKTFTITIDSKDVIVKLPDALPDMETAIFADEQCFNLTVCRQQFCLDAKAPDHDHVDFVFTDKGGVIALVWIKTFRNEYVAWKYVDGIPVLIKDISEINKLIRDAEKPKESVWLNLLYSSEPKRPDYGPVRVDFTYEGELNPDDFDNWELLRSQPDSRGVIWMFWQNPDPNSPIKIVVGEVYIDGTLILYRYFKYGVPYMFYLDSEKNKYVEYKFTDVEKKACMECHQDKVAERERYLKTI